MKDKKKKEVRNAMSTTFSQQTLSGCHWWAKE